MLVSEITSLAYGQDDRGGMRIKNFTARLVLIVGATLFAGTKGFAQENPDKSEEPVEVAEVDIADSDSDGTVTTEELKEFLRSQYFEAWAQKVDADQDGKISNKEFLLTQKTHEELLAEGGFAIAAKSKNSKKKKESKTAVQMMNERFLARKPLIGTTVEDLYAYDEDGEEVDFESLRGKHAVIVFGCLT